MKCNYADRKECMATANEFKLSGGTIVLCEIHRKSFITTLNHCVAGQFGPGNVSNAKQSLKTLTLQGEK